jgi:hypothetical protein
VGGDELTDSDRAKRIIKDHFDTSQDPSKGDSDTFGFGKLGDILTDDNHTLKHSIISPDMPQKIAILKAIDSKISSSIIETYLKTLLAANVSVKGQGRKDILKMAGSVAQGIQGALATRNEGLMRRFKRE